MANTLIQCICEPFDIHRELQNQTGWQIGGTIRDGSQDEKFIFGSLIFDIEMARKMAGSESNFDVEVSGDWSTQINVDPAAAVRGKSDRPVFVAMIPTEGGCMPLLIDGHHRMYRAMEEGEKSVAGYVFSPEETVQLIDTRPDLKAALAINLRTIAKGQPSRSDVHVQTTEEKEADTGDDGLNGGSPPAVAAPQIQEPAEEPALTANNDNNVQYRDLYKGSKKGKFTKKAVEIVEMAKSAEELAASTLSLVSSDEWEPLVVTIAKIDEMKQIVYGVILEPFTEDLQGDIISPEEIEATAHGYLEDARVIKSRHKGNSLMAAPVESYIAPADFLVDGGPYGRTKICKGSWVLGVKIYDPVEWRKVVKGEYTGFSVGGVGTREAV